jgi:hypothetical protein
MDKIWMKKSWKSFSSNIMMFPSTFNMFHFPVSRFGMFFYVAFYKVGNLTYAI